MIIFVGTVTDIAGVVAGIGSDVKNFKFGDKVVAKLNDVVRFHDVCFIQLNLCLFWCFPLLREYHIWTEARDDSEIIR